jgi:hypothetical protein
MPDPTARMAKKTLSGMFKLKNSSNEQRANPTLSFDRTEPSRCSRRKHLQVFNDFPVDSSMKAPSGTQKYLENSLKNSKTTKIAKVLNGPACSHLPVG